MATGLPTSVAVEIEYTSGVWTAVTTSVIGDSLTIRVGRTPASSSQPGTLSFDLSNTDGTYTPDNPLSTVYPNFVEGKRVRVVVVKGAATSYRFVGWITLLQPTLSAVAAQSYTVAFYPLTDTAASAGAVDIAGHNAPLTVWSTASGGSMNFAADTSASVEALPFVSMTSGKGLWHATPALSIDPTHTYWSVSILVNVTDASFGEVLSLSVGKRSGAAYYHSISWAATGWVLTVKDTIGTTVYDYTALTSTTPVIGWNHLRLAHTIDGLGVSLRVNGGNILGVGTNTVPFTCLSIGGSMTLSAGSLAISSGSPTASTYASNIVLATQTMAAALTAWSTIVGLSSLGASAALSATSSKVATPLNCLGRVGLDVLLDIASSESSVAYHAYTSADPQNVVVLARTGSRSSTVALTLDVEADLDSAPVLIREVLHKVAVASAHSPTSQQVVRDTTVAASVGQSAVDISTVLNEKNELWSVASDAISRGRDQKLRLAQVSFDLVTAQNDLYATWFAATPGSRVRVTGIPSTYFGVTYIDGYLEGWTERPTVRGYQVTLDLSAADAPREGLFDTSRWAFGDGVCTASVLTASGTSVTLTWTGTQTLSTVVGDYPLDLDINGERVTISSAPAGGTSPRTVTIVRGVAPTVARAHVAGDAVEIWNAARFAF